METPKIFVYGTLMGAFDNEMALLLRTHAHFVDKGTMKGLLYCKTDWLFPYPIAFWSEASSQLIYGEVYAFKNLESFQQAIVPLDAYEGVSDALYEDREYLRAEVPVALASGRMTICWAYVAAAPVRGLPLLTHGDFLRYAKKES